MKAMGRQSSSGIPEFMTMGRALPTLCIMHAATLVFLYFLSYKSIFVLLCEMTVTTLNTNSNGIIILITILDDDMVQKLLQYVYQTY